MPRRRRPPLPRVHAESSMKRVYIRLGLEVVHLAFDLEAHLLRQAAFSARTFGPGPRVQGVCDHIRKELIEVEDEGGPLAEWVDVIILAFDGAWRSGATPRQIIDAIVAKQAKNEARRWPDWRTATPGKAIEHDRTAEAVEPLDNAGEFCSPAIRHESPD